MHLQMAQLSKCPPTNTTCRTAQPEEQPRHLPARHTQPCALQLQCSPADGPGAFAQGRAIHPCGLPGQEGWHIAGPDSRLVGCRKSGLPRYRCSQRLTLCFKTLLQRAISYMSGATPISRIFASTVCHEAIAPGCVCQAARSSCAAASTANSAAQHS